MNFMSALNAYLSQFYGSAVAFAKPGSSSGEFYQSVIVRAVQSPEFRARLLKNPEAVLAEMGIELPDGVKVTFVENTERVVHIVIPPYVGD